MDEDVELGGSYTELVNKYNCFEKKTTLFFKLNMCTINDWEILLLNICLREILIGIFIVAM